MLRNRGAGEQARACPPEQCGGVRSQGSEVGSQGSGTPVKSSFGGLLMAAFNRAPINRDPPEADKSPLRYDKQGLRGKERLTGPGFKAASNFPQRSLLSFCTDPLAVFGHY
jgi:hypothetical protein